MARRSGVVAALLITLALSASFLCPARAAAGPVTSHAFSSFNLGGVLTSSMPLNGTVTLSITVANASGDTGIEVADQLPAGLVVAAVPNVTEGFWQTTGTVTAVPGSSTISLTGFGTVEPAAYVTVDVTGTSPGSKTDNLTSTSDQGGSLGVNDSSIDVVAPPSLSMVFPTPVMASPADTSLDFSITNPAANDVALTGVGFNATVAPGLTVTSLSSLSGCGIGSASIVNAGQWVQFIKATIAPGTACTFSAAVHVAAPGYFWGVSSAVTDDYGATGIYAAAYLSVGYVAPTIGAAFGSSSITAGGSTTLSFTLTNPNSNVVPDVQPAVTRRDAALGYRLHRHPARRIGRRHAQRSDRLLRWRHHHRSGRRHDDQPLRRHSRRGSLLHLLGLDSRCLARQLHRQHRTSRLDRRRRRYRRLCRSHRGWCGRADSDCDTYPRGDSGACAHPRGHSAAEQHRHAVLLGRRCGLVARGSAGLSGRRFLPGLAHAQAAATRRV